MNEKPKSPFNIDNPTYEEMRDWTYQDIYINMKKLQDDMLRECIAETNRRLEEKRKQSKPLGFEGYFVRPRSRTQGRIPVFIRYF